MVFVDFQIWFLSWGFIKYRTKFAQHYTSMLSFFEVIQYRDGVIWPGLNGSSFRREWNIFGMDNCVIGKLKMNLNFV